MCFPCVRVRTFEPLSAYRTAAFKQRGDKDTIWYCRMLPSWSHSSSCPGCRTLSSLNSESPDSMFSSLHTRLKFPLCLPKHPPSGTRSSTRSPIIAIRSRYRRYFLVASRCWVERKLLTVRPSPMDVRVQDVVHYNYSRWQQRHQTLR